MYTNNNGNDFSSSTSILLKGNLEYPPSHSENTDLLNILFQRMFVPLLG